MLLMKLKLIVMKKFYPALLFFLMCTGCSSVMMIKYQNQPNDVYANNNLKEYLKSNRVPKIVLRVPNTNDKATSNTKSTQNNAPGWRFALQVVRGRRPVGNLVDTLASRSHRIASRRSHLLMIVSLSSELLGVGIISERGNRWVGNHDGF